MRSSMRSRGVSLPRSWWRWTYFSPPPASGIASCCSRSASLANAASRLAAKAADVVSIAVLVMSVPQEFRSEVGQDFVGAAADAEDAHVTEVAVDLGLAHVA